MPKNREALIRYRIINRLLVNRKYASLKEITFACEEALDKAPISVRTIRQDIFDMKNNRQLGFHAPISYDYYEKAYYYAERNYSIDRLPLTEEEVDALEFASMMLEQFKETEPFNHVRGAVEKIMEHMKIRKALANDNYRDFIDFEKSTAPGGGEFLKVSINAMKKKKVIWMTYKSFEKDHASTFLFHPYLLKEYRNRWYIFGYNEDYKEPRTYALDRILKIEPESLKTFIEPKFPPQDYFSKIIGITRTKGSKAGKVKLKFSRLQSNYVLTQPLHESQQVLEETDEYTIISLDIHDSPDLTMILLGWGSEVEVMEPPALRNEIKRIHEQSADIYREKPIVYFDLDCVLVDFQSGIDQITEDVKQKYENHFDDVPGIFSLMKPIPEGLKAFHRINKKYDCYILSTAPWKNPTAWSDKLEWVKNHLGQAAYKRLIISHHKELNCGSFLIDDRDKHGAEHFRGKLIRLGSEEFPDWEAVLKFLGV